MAEGLKISDRPVFSHADIMRVMAGVMVCILLAALDQTVVIPALPAMAMDLGAKGQLSWVVAAYLITSTISTPIYGKLSDIYGRRRLLLTCITAFVFTSMLCGFAESLDQLIWFRALQGLGGGGLMALTQAAIADVVSPRERGRYQGYISAVWALTSLSGPVLGGMIAEAFSWRVIFWINLPLGAAAFWICRGALRRLMPPRLVGKPTLDILGMTLFSAAVTALLLALGWGGTVYPWLSPEILGLASLGGILICLLVRQERKAVDPLLPPSVFINRSYVANILVSTLTSVLMFLCLFTIPLNFQIVHGTGAAQSGAYLVPFMLSSAVGNIAGSRWARYAGTLRGAVRLATVLSFSGLSLLAILRPYAPTWSVMIGLVVTGVGIGVCFIGSITSAQNALTPRDIGSGTAALLVLRAVGGASGSTLAGAILASGSGVAAVGLHATGNFAMVYAAGAVLSGVSFVTAWWMPNTPLRETLSLQPLSE